MGKRTFTIQKVIIALIVLILAVSQVGCDFQPNISTLEVQGTPGAQPFSTFSANQKGTLQAVRTTPIPNTFFEPAPLPGLDLTKPFCANNKGYEDSSNLCIGNHENGWREIKQNGKTIAYILSFKKEKYEIKVVDGKFYISCSLSKDKGQEIDQQDADNLKQFVTDLEDANKKFDETKLDLIAGLTGLGVGAAAACVAGGLAGALIVGGATIELAGIGAIPGWLAGCLGGVGFATVAAVYGMVIEKGIKMFDALQKVWKAEGHIQEFIKAKGLYCRR